MRILWPRVDRSRMVAPYYSTLQHEVGRLAHVTFVTKPWWDERGRVTGDTRPEPVLSPELIADHDVLVTDSFFCFMHEDWGQLESRKVNLVTDAHAGARSYALNAQRAGFDRHLIRYWQATRQLIPELYEQQTAWLPLEVDERLHGPEPRAWGDRKPMALLTGQARADVYPLRARVALELQGYVRTVARPANRADAWPKGRDYRALLEDYQVGIADVSIYGYPVLKYLEIAAAGCVLWAEWHPELAALGFEPGVSMVPLDPGRGLVAQLAELMARDDLELIAARGRQLVMERHTGSVRARQLVDLLERDEWSGPA